ncbi:MAG: hypothetical protein GXP41_01170, partial [Chloroflexi bacterium]|nr:hypothetical protein [Chloroflexota bacterium]
MKRANLVERLSFTVIAGFAIVLAMGVGFAIFGRAPARTALSHLSLSAPAKQLASALPLPSPAEREVQAAWRRAQQAGAYHFATDILQTTYLAPRVTNVGRSSRQDTLHIEGETNLPDRTMQMALWQNGGSVLNPGDGVEIRIKGDQAYGRQSGGAWQKMDNISTSFAPGNDLLAYLAGAKNVKRVASSVEREDTSRSTLHAARYTFDVDGPAFGRYLRDQLERYLQENGELPAGLTLDVSNQYRSIIGHGEVWIDSDGLPQHLTVHLEYPQQPNGERITADIKTDFAQFDRGFLAQSTPSSSAPLSGALARLDLSRALGSWGHTGTQAGLLALFALLTLMMIAYRESKKVYTAVALAVTISTVVTPLLQVQRVAAFSERQTTKRTEQVQAQREQSAVRQLREQLHSSDWDPHHDPLSVSNQPSLTIDNSPPSGSPFGSASATAPNPTSDADHDGLTYAQEIRLGTDPNKADSDGDKLRDDLEVKGFELGGKRWYSDPNSADTNNDGMLDTMECWGTIPAGVSNTACDLDTDKDGTPNLFDRDNDNDGVPDRVDSAPDEVVPGFGNSNPLKLVVDNLQAKSGNKGYPVFVDFQIRPNNPDHLSYAMNVFDWPSGDRQGEVKRVKNNTLASQMNPQPPSDNANWNGDMRLTPMLEIKIPASSGQIPPLPLTNPQATRQIEGWDGGTRWISATLTLKQQGNDTTVNFQFEGATSGVKAEYFTSACPVESSKRIWTDYDIVNGNTRTHSGQTLTKLVDGKHSVVLSHGDNAVCANLGDIPNGPYSDKMIDTAKLQTHGIAVRDADDKGNMVAYVPLNLVQDETHGSKVAFAARMVYWPNNVRTWGKAHEVRVVWLVQALTDSCKPTPKNWQTSLPEEQRRTAWCLPTENWVTSPATPVHTYPEDWTLTGLSVREDHGMEIAVAYEDPAHDNDKTDDSRLWKLADGLQKTFTSPRDQNSNKIRDIGIVTRHEGRSVADESIKSRFDNQSNGSVATSKLWGIPRNALRVKTYSYPHQDYLAKIPSEITPDILKTSFSHDDTPTLLFAREEYHRTAGLDTPGGVVAISGNQVKINMSADKVSPSTLASMNWGPFRYRNGAWEAYPLDKYWDKMAVKFKKIFKENPPKDEKGLPMYSTSAPDAEVIDGLVTASQAYYISMVQGSNKVVAFDYVALVTAKIRGAVADASLAQATVNSVGAGLELIANQVSGDFISVVRLNKYDPFLEDIARIKDTVSSAGGGRQSKLLKKKRLKMIAKMKKASAAKFKLQVRNKNLAMGAKAGLSAAALSMSIAASYDGKSSAGPVLKNIALSLAVVSEVVDTVETVQSVAKAWRGAKAAATMAGKVSSFSGTYRAASSAIAKDIRGASMKAGVVLTVIAIGVTVGVFIAQWAEGSFGAFGGLAFDAALAGMVATIIATVIMFAISLIPIVGQIIAAVIALIDAVVAAVCAIADAVTDGDLDFTFAMDSQYASDLNAGALSNGFRQQYIIKVNAYNDGRDADAQLPSQLSTNISIEKKSDSKWLLTDDDAGTTFTVKKASTKLNLYIPATSFSGSDFGKWFCKGISGLFTYAIQWSIYSQTSLVGNLHSDSRTQTMDFHPALVDAAKGFSVGNRVKYSLKVKNAITLADVPFDWKAALYFWQYSYANLDSATIKHVLKTSNSTSNVNKIKGLERNQMEDQWQRKSKYLDGETALVMTEPLSKTIALDETGINRPVNLYLAEAYAVPTQECWFIPLASPIPVCYIRTDDNDGKTTFSDLGKSMKWDVFPATLDGFYACESGNPSDTCHKDGGYSLGWGQTGDLTFPRMKDFDGDGLLNKKDGGNDPNDSKWDTDGDGLSDPFELQQGSDPTLADTDGDGLTDYQEVLYKTNPNRQDSDGDGLTDKQEIDGWEFVYALKADRSQLKTWVTSDPLSIDGDGDTLTDFQEKVYGFNPRVKSDLNLLDYSSKIIEPDAPVMLLRFEETDGATTFSDVSGYTNNGACQGSTCPAAGHLGRYGNAVVFDGSGDYLNAGGGLDLANQSFTVAFWAKRDATGGHNMFVFGQGSSGVNHALQLGFRDNNTFTCAFYGNDLNTPATYTDQDWHYWACTYEASTHERIIYRDGTQVAQDTAAANYQGSGDVLIGKAPWGDYFSGRVDELAVFSKALSASEVQTARDARYNYSDSIVKPGQTITYQGTVENKLFNRYVNGLLSTDFPGAVQDNVPPTSFILQPAETQTLSGDVTVKSSATSGKAILSQVAGGIVVDRREQSGYAELWLPFNEESGAGTFSDFSGNMPARNGICSGGSCPQAGQKGVIGNAVKFDGNDFLNAGNRINLAGKSFTVAFWAKRDAIGGRNMFVIGQGTESTNHALQLGFRSNNKFTCGFYGNDLDTEASYADQNWHHWACTYDAAGGSRTIYRDGLEADGDWHVVPNSRYQGTGDLYIGKAPWGSNFSGTVDDVRVYARALSADEIAGLAGIPVLKMGLDESGSQFFAAGVDQNASCSGSSCPSQTGGISGNARDFDGSEYITLSSGVPDLRNQSFTFSVWLNPQDSNEWRGVLGSDFGDELGYPSMALKGRDLRFGFGNEAQWLEHTTTNAVTLNTWNHVVITFDGSTYRVFVNGVKKDETGDTFSGQLVDYALNKLYLGRANGFTGTVYLDHLNITDEADGSGNAELCIAWRDRPGGEQRQIWSNHDVDTGHYDVKKSLDFQKEGYLRIWENDGGTYCGSNQDDGDDFVWDHTFSINDPAIPGTKKFFTSKSNDTEGYVWLGNETTPALKTPPSLPFKGKMDEFSIYKRALSAEEVQTLYQSYVMALRLPFDEAPGAGLSHQGFANVADITGQSKGTCSGSSCPTNGVSGRVNQAALFDGSDDYVDAGNIDLVNQSFTLSAWAKRNSTGSYDFIIGQGSGSANHGLQFGFRDNNQFTCAFWANDLNTSGTYSDQKWHYWTCTYDATTRKRTIYRDGTQVAQDTASAHYQGSGHLMVGSFPVRTDFNFDGRLDDVRVYRAALSAGGVRALYQAAPGFSLHFDEAKGASTFHDGSDNSHNGSCSGDWCPKTGVKGQMGLAAEFDGQNDVVRLPNASTLGLKDSSFTVMAWIRAKQLAKPNSPDNSEGDSAILGTDERSNNQGLHLVIRDGKPLMGLYGNDTAGTIEIKPNFWYHLTWRYDKDKGEQAIFVNGSLDTAKTGHSAFQGNGTVYVGRALGGRYFNGRIDELAIYPSALSAKEIRDIFLYQGSWVEERESHEITIDTDVPTSELSSYLEGGSNYRANKDAMFGIQAQDTTSSVKLAELGVRKDGQSSTTWIGAPACQDTSPIAGGNEGGAWCPTFKPADFGGEGTYTFWTRATDAVGHRESPSKTYSLYVDGTPPNVTTTTPDGALLTPRRDSTRPNTWLLSFSGAVSDPNLSSGAAGSGLVADSVRVRLVDADGQTAGKTARPATVSGSQWSVEYPLYQANPTGVYTLTVEAADNVGNEASTALATIQVDASPAGAELDTDAVSANVISDTVTLQGVAQDTPSLPGAVLRLHLDEAAGSHTFIDTSGRGNHATCSGSACPTAGEIGQFGRALQFNGANSAAVLNSLDFAKADYTVAAWFKSGAAAVQDILLAATSGGQPGIRLQLASDGKPHYLHRFPADSTTGSELAGGQSLNDNAWHHLAAVKRGSSLSLYVDGAVVASGNDSSAAAGALNVTLGQHFNGLLDDVQVYKQALTVSDIRSLAQTQVSGVAGVDIAFTPRSGSAPFYDGSNGDSQLHLPF